jgi:hypothetical protein
MKKQSLELINRWFTGLNQTNLNDLLILFAKNPIIKNAANSEISGEKAAQQLLEGFFSRTESRHFELLDAAETENEIFAFWIGEYVFRPGVQIADVVLEESMTVKIKGVERFCINEEFRIVRCDIMHETTSIVIAAKNSKAKIEQSKKREFNPTGVVHRYFEAEEIGDVEAVVSLCAPNVKVINAANPPQYGFEGVRQYVQVFKERTSQRKFIIGKIATNKNVTFAFWNAVITFNAGVTFGAITTLKSFTVELQGVCRFVFDEDGKIEQLFVFHETTTALLKAVETLK